MITNEKVIRAISNLHTMAVYGRYEYVRKHIDNDFIIALHYISQQRIQQEKTLWSEKEELK